MHWTAIYLAITNGIYLALTNRRSCWNGQVRRARGGATPADPIDATQSARWRQNSIRVGLCATATSCVHAGRRSATTSSDPTTLPQGLTRVHCRIESETAGLGAHSTSNQAIHHTGCSNSNNVFFRPDLRPNIGSLFDSRHHNIFSHPADTVQLSRHLFVPPLKSSAGGVLATASHHESRKKDLNKFSRGRCS